jgi:hypothetical protein
MRVHLDTVLDWGLAAVPPEWRFGAPRRGKSPQNPQRCAPHTGMQALNMVNSLNRSADIPIGVPRPRFAGNSMFL